MGDITYVHTWAGFAYLATVIDCYSKAVIGWSVADHMRTDLVTDAPDMARRNHQLADDCIFHSDRGTQYTSCSASAGTMRLAESFFAALKNELVYRTAFPPVNHARKAIASYIEVFYNRQRLHSGLAYRTPHEVHAEHETVQPAA